MYRTQYLARCLHGCGGAQRNDYESIHRASRRLASRYGVMTLNAMLEAWEALAQDVGEGFDAEFGWE